MKLNINIITDAHCRVIVEDRTEYLNEENQNVLKELFRYSDTTSIIVLQHNKTTGPVVLTPIYDLHLDPQYIEVPVGFDGWFTVNYLVLPTTEWFFLKYESNPLGLAIYDIVYFTDGCSIYKVIPSQLPHDKDYNLLKDFILPSSIEEILEINPINTTISKTAEDYISICFLQKCYVNLCQQILNDRAFSKCWSKNAVDSELVYKRDLVWMAINVIKYLTEFNQLSEVERIIEQINGCNGLCKSNSTYLSTSSGCGCSK